MADRGAIAFGMTRQTPAWFHSMPALLGRKPRHPASTPHDFKLAIIPSEVGAEALAFEMYAGHFTFAGQSISTTPVDAFSTHPVPLAWREALFGLEWLQHFNASGRALHAQFAMCLLQHWHMARKPQLAFADQAKILCVLASHGQAIARRCDENRQTGYFEIITAQTRLVLRTKTSTSEDAVLKALALLYATSAVQGLEAAQAPALTLLNEHIDHIILPDGGHMSRDVNKVLDFLRIALPLQQAMQSHNVSAPLRLTRAIERSLGLLSLLHGGAAGLSAIAEVGPGQDSTKVISDLIERHPVHSGLAPHAGFARIDRSKTSLIANISKTFAIELFHEKQSLIYVGLNLAGTAYPAQVIDAPQGAGLSMSSSQQSRTCFLSADGTDLRVEDQCQQQQVTLVLAQGVKLSLLQDGHAIMLVTPHRDVWHLTWRGGEARIQQSAGQQQIIIRPSGSLINWSLKKQAKTNKAPRRKVDPEPDLLI